MCPQDGLWVYRINTDRFFHMVSPNFRTDFDPRYGEAVEMVPGLVRITCNNPSPFTFHGTNTYMLGDSEVSIIDPGPADLDHLDAIEKAIGGRKLRYIIVTHTHMDHSPLASVLAKKTGATVLAEGPHRAARPLHIGEINVLDASGDKDFQPDDLLSHGDIVDGGEWKLKTLFTPGHTANHLAFGWKDTDYLFPGDHVMAWATSIVAPPDGAMSDYMQSLEVLLEESQQTYFPGHGGRLEKAHGFVRALRAHRKMRETAVLDQVTKGRASIPDMVAVIYRTTDKRLHGAAGLSVLAHLEDLVAKGKVAVEGTLSIDSKFKLAD